MKERLLAAIIIFALASPALAQEKEIGLEGVPESALPKVDPSVPKADWMNFDNPYGEKDSLAKANHTSDEVMAWSARAVSDTLTFKDNGFNAQVKAAQKFFNQAGWAEYAAYLTDSKLLEAGRSGKYVITTISDGAPMILNSGAVNGAWHWTMSVPVITSVSQGGVPAFEAKTLSTRKARIRLEITRVAEGGDDGLAVESWKLLE